MLSDFNDIVSELKQTFHNFSSINEQLSLQRIDSLILNKIPNPKDRVLFRIIYQQDTQKMYLTSFETESKEWELEKKRESSYYFEKELIENPEKSIRRVFLHRNLLKKRSYNEWISKNNIEFNVCYNIHYIKFNEY